MPSIVNGELARSAFQYYRLSGKSAEAELGVRFRDAIQAVLETLAGERAAYREARERTKPRNDRRA
jgi:hypothetical protein